MGMVAAGDALCVPGNHDMKLLRELRGRNVQVTHGLAESLAQIDARAGGVPRPTSSRFLDGLVSHYVLDDGKLVVAHAGLKEEMQGRARAGARASPSTARRPARPTSSACRCATTGREEYRGRAMVVYGHTPVPSRSGSTTRSTSTPAASSAAGSPPCATRSGSSSRSRPAGSTASRPGRSRSPPTTWRPPTAGRRDPEVLDVDDVLGQAGHRDADRGRDRRSGRRTRRRRSR